MADVVDEDGVPVAGAAVTKPNQPVSSDDILYFTADMSGFVDGDKTTASGTAFMPETGIGNDSADDGGAHDWSGTLGQGGSNGVCVTVELKAE